ncbi:MULTISPECIES: HAD-IIB family hydrolase [Limnospira]|uniref:HAD-IIB family hydrolase n=1 Tax=Limnospira TaxID=2596745 RepID=UPI0001D0EDC3|nr:HAD-IIB family hydrolase [Arthrospira platensis NCB002]MDT9183947.1 HAD-IIB family hydrolase [Limnospira sp. PMC 289.06]BAI90985.1 HAD-superfamily hydrolase [Arthrospira platensis NIES-39]BDT13307.1 HAD-superfamily hydrolase [Arthrospira platensis NIES-39]
MLLIFTDLDGTLLNSDDYGYHGAITAIADLQQQQIPIIPVTSKTRAEVEVLSTEIGLTDSFIVENGSAIFIPKHQDYLVSEELKISGKYYLMQLGCVYAQVRQGLRELMAAIGEELTGFGDLTIAEIMQLTGLSTQEAQRAKNREFTEPFITPKNVDADRLAHHLKALGFNVVVGDRFSHLIGQTAGKGGAVQWLVNQYQQVNRGETITTIGLGNSPNDLAMLEVVDIPIIIPGIKGVHPGLANQGWKVAPFPGSVGWGVAVAEEVKGLIY